MTNRRKFLQATIATAAGALAANTSQVSAMASSLPGGLIYTKENPGMWSGKIKGHLPVVTVAGNKVTVETKHGMSNKHFIVRHTLVTKGGEVIDTNTFSPKDEAAVSIFELPAGEHAFYATSFCNKHDLWVTEFSVG